MNNDKTDNLSKESFDSIEDFAFKFNVETEFNEDYLEDEGSLYTDKQIATKRQVHDLKMAMLDASRSMLKDLENIKMPVYVPDTKKRSISGIYSDDHFGKMTYDITSNEPKKLFNMKTAPLRLEYFSDQMFNRVLENPTVYDEIIFNMVGDHIEGDGGIFPSQPFELETIARNQVFGFANIMMRQIKKASLIMKDVGGFVRVFGVPGNHGEQRGKFIRAPGDNWDMVIFNHLKVMILENQSFGNMMNVSIEYPQIEQRTYYSYIMKGWRVFLNHIFAMNITTPVGSRKILVQNDNFTTMDKENKGIDLLYTGHYHFENVAAIGKTTFIRTGSLTGYDEFAEQINANFSAAMHTIIETTTEQKILTYIPVQLDHIRYVDLEIK